MASKVGIAYVNTWGSCPSRLMGDLYAHLWNYPPFRHLTFIEEKDWRIVMKVAFQFDNFE
ncbi:hypothetical protein T11_14530 [Trichinella zimbabwensis]|uniref:Uncharacterized protein n=1 Tax=Trichinella zimbabwensis TaxID=268475 RepID=A0A0V1GNY6_9BILA|nr:hypothetical protein T11_14802 [Trichinella zimbabwensis]KRZ11912.1 hypothetical protein T11_14530 [Trichinella zimbabwensis]